MNKPLSEGRGLSLTIVAATALLLVHAGASALGLGRLTVQSTLGEALRAEIEITSITPEEAASLRASLASPEAFRAAGVDFNAALAGAQTSIVKRPDGRTVIRLTGDRSVGEPFVDVLLDFSWNGGRLQRSYTLLIDPPTRPASAAAALLTAPAVATPPALATAPVPPAPVAPPPRPQPAPPPPRPALPPAPAPAPARAPAPMPAPVAAPKPASAPAEAASGDEYRVRRGDTLSGIAVSRMPAGVSLDQMLVSLYRGNPQAFTGNNMNRLRSGAVLNLPSAEEAGRISAGEARQVIQAHSADFAEFRRQLAGAAPTVPANQPPRQTSGKVEAAVKDNKTAAAPPPPDKLTLSRGAAASAEAKLSKEAERKAADQRVQELARNVTELQKMAASSAAASAPAKVAAAAPVAASVASASSALNLPLGAPAVASMPASSPVAASQPAMVAPVASAPQAASAPASAPKKRPAASAPPKPAAEPDSPSFLESLTSSPFVLPLAVGVVALLAGLGLMRVRRRSQEATGETSFLESKLQPDSFFGVSGGQRVDTRDGDASSAASSSLNYSLSQLDAIGDVDPVAEADVYLAYGRDLQAEEILKEALRTDPGRAAIRSKLLEVYAKRVDLPAFEAQALQLREVVGDDGDDWLKAQAMGRQLDPGNPLYGAAQGEPVDIDTSSEPPPDLRDPAPAREAMPDIEKTLPLDEPAGRVSDNGLDLDIDLESPAASDLAATQPADAGMMLNNGAEEPAARVEDPLPELPTDDLPRQDPPNSGPVDFDFGDLSLDLDEGAPKAPAAAPAAAASPAAALPDLGDDGDVDDDDPLARKLELADEFRRIGDTEGARDLLEEVISQAEGSLRAKAQAMLDGLG